MTKYLKLKENEKATDLRIDILYNKGQYFCYKPINRGYYINITPVTRKGVYESFMCFSGAKMLVHEVARQSEKAYKIATEKAENYMQKMIDYVCNEQGLELA